MSGCDKDKHKLSPMFVRCRKCKEEFEVEPFGVTCCHRADLETQLKEARELVEEGQYISIADRTTDHHFSVCRGCDVLISNPCESDCRIAKFLEDTKEVV